MKALLIALFAWSLSLPASAHSSHAGATPTVAQTAHLKFAEGVIHAHLKWLEGPKVDGESVLELQWKESETHANIDIPGDFKVSLWMPAHNHGSAPTQITQLKTAGGDVEKGAYRVSRVYFTMPGEWDVRVTLNYDDGTKETQTVKVKLAGTHGH